LGGEENPARKNKVGQRLRFLRNVGERGGNKEFKKERKGKQRQKNPTILGKGFGLGDNTGEAKTSGRQNGASNQQGQKKTERVPPSARNQALALPWYWQGKLALTGGA